MTDYKAIKGKTILNIASDLDNPEGEGQIWFNTTSSDFKTISLAAGAWATGGTMNTARRSGSVGADDADAATFVGGSSAHDECEQYDGSSWTEVADLNTGRTGTGGGGTKASMITCAGQHTARVAIVEEWDDSSWTEIADVNTARNEGLGFAGTSTSALLFGGMVPSQSALTETWNGTSWTEVGDLNTARSRIASSTEGTVTAALAAGGFPYSNVSETWDGSSWAEGNNLNTARQEAGGAGIVTIAMAYGGQKSGAAANETEEYDGTSWSEKNNLNSARRHCTTGGGTQRSAITAGGEADPGVQSATEEWSKVTHAAAGTWASGTTINTARHQMGSAGASAISGITFGGNTTAGTGSPYVIKDESEEYDGTTWTEGNDLNTARANLAGSGTQTAALGTGGQKGASNDDAEEVESYDGTSWTEVSDLNTARMEHGAFGTQTAAFAICGLTREGSNTDKTLVESWDGSSWTETTDIGTARYGVAAAGITAGGIIAGGDNNASSPYALSEEWNGSAWAEGNDLNSGRIRVGGFGLSAATAVAVGGRSGSSPGGGWGEHDDTEEFDGTSWAEKNDLSTGRAMTQGAGVHTTGFLAGGNLGPSGPNTGITEEWVKAQTVKTITD